MKKKQDKFHKQAVAEYGEEVLEQIEDDVVTINKLAHRKFFETETPVEEIMAEYITRAYKLGFDRGERVAKGTLK